MKYNFNKLTNRHNTNSVKWDSCEGVLPMWIADMDFEVAPCIQKALHKKIDEDILGYTRIPDSYYKSVSDWFERRHGLRIEREWVNVVQGVVPAIEIAIAAFCDKGDKVLIQGPSYTCFFSAVENQECVLHRNDLVYDEKSHSYSIDFEEFEQKCADPRCKVFLLCNPQNPTGRMWKKDELARMGEIARRHNVIVISDEIHCEIQMPGFKYVPFAGISEEDRQNCVMFCSPTKGFNLAGLQVANIVVPNPELKKKVDDVIRRWHHNDVNQIGIIALQAAYTPKGEDWLDSSNRYIWENYLTLKKMFEEQAPEFPVTSLEATYLAWINCRALHGCFDSKQISDSLKEKEKVWVNEGDIYGVDDFIRINLACPRKRLIEGTQRVIDGLKRLSILSRKLDAGA